MPEQGRFASRGRKRQHVYDSVVVCTKSQESPIIGNKLFFTMFASFEVILYSPQPPHTPGSLIGLTKEGETPVDVGGGRKRHWLQDGDHVILSGSCEGKGFRVGFGTCEGKILPSSSFR